MHNRKGSSQVGRVGACLSWTEQSKCTQDIPGHKSLVIHELSAPRFRRHRWTDCRLTSGCSRAHSSRSSGIEELTHQRKRMCRSSKTCAARRTRTSRPKGPRQNRDSSTSRYTPSRSAWAPELSEARKIALTLCRSSTCTWAPA